MPKAEERVRSIRTGGSEMVLLGTLKGLVSEAGLVRDTFEKFGPNVICVHIGREEIEGLKAVVEGRIENTYLSSLEKVYAREISRFGEVQIPPPSLVEACRISIEEGIPLKPLDFDESAYSDIYTDLIGGMTMVRQSLSLKRINRKKFRSATAEGFVLEWDRLVNRFRGFRKLEKRREERMASRLGAICRKHGRTLGVVEYERMNGIISYLDR